MNRDQQVATLNRLLRLCRDSENGFLVAAENVRNRGLKAMLNRAAEASRIMYGVNAVARADTAA